MYDLIIGSLLIFSWINCFLFALEVTAVTYYFKKYRGDGMILKATVGACILLDTICTIANNLGVYRYNITHWGDVSYLSEQEWQIPLYLICTGIVAAVVQSFLIIRYKNLSGNLIVCIPLFVLVLASFAGSLATAIMIIMSSSLSDRASLKIPVIVWFVLSAVLDCSISGLLIYHLRSGQTKFKASQIDRLTSVAIQTGSTTSIVAIVILVVFLSDPEGNVATGFGQCLGRLYSISMLWNLIIRASISARSPTPSVEAGNLAPLESSGGSCNDEKAKDDSSISKQ